MYGYPVVRPLMLFVSLFMWSGNLSKVTTLHLRKNTIKADRTSPAFSAIEDATTLKDLQFDFQFKRQTETKTKVQKLNLDGVKISAQKIFKTHAVKLAKAEKLDLLGEKIEVKHFTEKFVKPKLRHLIAKNTKKLGDAFGFKSQWKPKSSTGKKALLSAHSPEGQRLALSKKVLPSGIVLSVPDLETETVIEPSTATIQSSVQSVASNQRLGVNSVDPVKITGNIILDGGSYLHENDFTYHIERHSKGHVHETGVITGDTNSFELELLDSQGFISVELRAPEGEILAYGEADLKDLKSNVLDVSLQPTEGLFAGRVLDDQKSKQDVEQGVALAKTYISGVSGSLSVDEDGFFGDTSLFNLKSHFVSSTAKKDFWPTVTLSESGKALYPRLVKNSFIESLSATIDPYEEEVKIDSLLMGNVTHMGMSQSNMVVEIYGQEYQKPIYFSKSGRPEPALIETTTDGGFMFVNLPDGGYLLQVKKNKKTVSQKWFIVKSGHISKGQIDLRQQESKLAVFKTFPGRSMKNSLLEIQEIGDEKFEEVSSAEAASSGVELESTTRPALTAIRVKLKDVDKDFDQLHMIPSRSKDQNLKLIDETWLSTFLNHNRSNRNQALGLVVGFIEDESFELVKETSEALTDRSEIYYFNKDGDKIDTGEAGGGFIVTNTKLGFQNLILKLQSEDKFLNKIVLTAPSSISVF